MKLSSIKICSNFSYLVLGYCFADETFWLLKNWYVGIQTFLPPLKFTPWPFMLTQEGCQCLPFLYWTTPRISSCLAYIFPISSSLRVYQIFKYKIRILQEFKNVSEKQRKSCTEFKSHFHSNCSLCNLHIISSPSALTNFSISITFS